MTLEKMLRNVKVIEDDNAVEGEVFIGSMVKVRDIEMDEVEEYKLVGTVEADPMNNRISNESPVGRAIMGHKVGEIVDVEVPTGIIKYEIVSVAKA